MKTQIPHVNFNYLYYSCANDKFSYTLNIQPVGSEAQPPTYTLKAIVDMHELASNTVLVQCLDFPKENVYKFKTPEEALNYIKLTEVLIPTPNASEILVLNLETSSLFKIKKQSRTLESFKCVQVPRSN